MRVFAILFFLLSARIAVGQENRYWVGKSSGQNWGSSANWSATPGGRGGASVPGVKDNAIFDNTSASCIINESVKVGEIRTGEGFNGSIIQKGSIACNTIVLNGGTFTGD